VAAACIQLGEPARAAAPLLKAVRKVQPSAVFLTPQHVSFLQVCVLAKLYQQATDLLADDVCEVRCCCSPREGIYLTVLVEHGTPARENETST